ncbi:MAG: DUF5667 domain-containing protein [Candidatus Shapirobacteria bacterium]|jgi:hypothetical protein
MIIKKILLFTLFFFSISFLTPTISVAVDSPKAKISSDTIFIRITERVEYFFAFGTDKKIAVLEKQAENRLDRAQNFADGGNNEKVQNQLQSYRDKKQEQNYLLEKTDGGRVLKNVEERTIEQQKTMENIKTVVDEGMKQEVMQIQEQVVNQVAQRVVETNGKEGQTEFFNKVEHVWAPGTGPGGEAGVIYQGGAGQQFAPGTSAGGIGGVVYEGGARIMFAPGTSSGGNAGSDIKTVEVKGN